MNSTTTVIDDARFQQFLGQAVTDMGAATGSGDAAGGGGSAGSMTSASMSVIWRSSGATGRCGVTTVRGPARSLIRTTTQPGSSRRDGVHAVQTAVITLTSAPTRRWDG